MGLPLDVSSPEVTNGGSTRAKTIEITIVSGEHINDSGNTVVTGAVDLSNLINVEEANNNPKAFQLSNCRITNIKRKIREVLGGGIENPAQVDSTTNFHKKSTKFILTIEAIKHGKCSIILPEGGMIVSSYNNINSEKFEFTWTYKKRNLFRNFFILSSVLFITIKSCNKESTIEDDTAADPVGLL